MHKKIQQQVLAYYRKNRRVLPWRENPTPYYVWVSEIMLQQTRVETVIPYFLRFIESFPTIEALAAADEEILLKSWEGLGYYSRARNLQKAAKILVRQYDARLPSQKAELMKLPGIGAYTAGAIASIAYGKKETAIDGNLIRVGSRLIAYPESISNAKGKHAMQQLWQSLLPDEQAGDFNQAIMDIGATICLPNGQPLCTDCPISAHCKAYRQGNPTDYPVKEKKKARRIELKTVFLLHREHQLLLEKRPDSGLLRSMLQFPMTDGHLSEQEALDYCRSRGYQPIRIQSERSTKHLFSHVEWHMIAWEITLDPFVLMEENMQWIDKDRLNEITMPTAFRTWRKDK